MKLKWLLAAWAFMPAFACADESIAFDWFEYSGHDSIYNAPLPAGQFHNPILAGYYPDPGIVRAGDAYYLVNSTFAHFPGIPIHKSYDLVHWYLSGYALNDPDKVSFDGLTTSKGVFAPSIAFNKDTFYIVNTLVGAGGNFFVMAKSAEGPWTDPIWLKEIDGIDPSFFFDADGKAYIVNNGPPVGKPRYEGHRAIWIQEFDVAANKLIGPRKVIVNGGVDIRKKPIWIEGPHLYHIDGWYYLMCAEGGTERGHSEVIFRAKSPWGPFVPNKQNPILTQRDLPADRPNPVTNAGHADLVQMEDGSWWSVFLASRPYSGYRFNTGRETFLLPVTWKDGWPLILPKGVAIPTTLPAPKAMTGFELPSFERLSGNFIKRDEFEGPPDNEWLTVHVTKHPWWDFTRTPGLLYITPQKVNLDEKRNAAFLARRQQHTNFDASTGFKPPAQPGVAAGLAAYQNEGFWYFLGSRRVGAELQVFLERRERGEAKVVAQTTVVVPKDQLSLKISGAGQNYSFYYDAGQGWQALRENDDGSILSTEVAGGFVGTVLGPFARQE